MNKKIVGVLGGHSKNTTPEAIHMAEGVGEALAQRGYAVVCGGFDGVMEAACRGCKKAGGTTLAILKGNDTSSANDFVDYAIPTSMDVACNNIIVWASIAVIAFDGRYGTLNEMALALDFGKPLICVGKQKLLQCNEISDSNFALFPNGDISSIKDILDKLEELVDNHNTRASHNENF